MKPTVAGLPKATSGRRDAKDDQTSRAAREIIDKEVAERVSKTERLRAARLEMESNQEPLPAAKAKARKVTGPRRARSN